MPEASPTFLVSELWPDRYTVGRTKVYDYLKALNITPFKPDGDKRSHITLEQLEALDHYTKLLAEAGPEAAQAYADRLAGAVTTAADTSMNVSAAPPLEPADIPPAIATLAHAIAQQLWPSPQLKPLAPQRYLEEACAHAWQLKTRQLRELGINPSIGSIYGFELRRVRRGWWLVEKASAEVANRV